ncbi:MAG: RNA 2',3'-cyclic phosphodiesterase [Clostridia bacterium]|nr:RNA 2',3'-cyclic phosphodiesterase [Clostridia bacterium]
MAAWMDGLAPELTGLKWVEPATLHVTLRFLGELNPREAARVREALRPLGQRFPAFPLRFEGVGAFPSPAMPRVLWVGTTGSDGLQRLWEGVQEALAQAGWPAEAGPFRPHLTVARVRRPGRRPDVEAAVAAARGRVFGEMVTRSFRIYESRLQPTGPVYEALETVELRGGGAERGMV